MGGYSFTYPDGTEVLRSASLEINEGERVGLVGPNGSGKSTLLGCLAGCLRGEGALEVCGMEVAKKNLKAIRRQVGVVLQDPDDMLFMPTVYDDVAFGPLNLGVAEEDVRLRVEEALENLGLMSLAHKPPYRLSGGQKKLTSIAAVLSMYPRVLILDEPSSALDDDARALLIEVLNRLCPSTTLLVACHNTDFVIQTTTRLLCLDQGRIKEPDFLT